MPHEQDMLKDELLDRATESLRHSIIPDGPPPEVIAKVLANLGMAENANATHIWKRFFTMNALVKLAVAAILAIGIGGMLLWGTGRWGTNLTFADVLKEVRKVQSVQYTQTVTVSVPGQPPQMLMSGQSKTRFTIQGQVIILDSEKGRFLEISPDQKVAMVGDLVDFPAPQVNMWEVLQRLPKDAKSIGEKEIGGRRADGFQGKGGGTLWVDSSTRMPLLMEFHSPAQGMMPPVKVTMSDFVWNPPVDESLMSLTPPAGYQVLQATKMDVSAPTAADLTAGLKAIAELNGGTFPADIDMSGLRRVMRELGQRVQNDKTLRDKMMAMGPGAMLTIGRMWGFIGDAHNGDDWHYAGEGVALGRAGRAIFWYRPAGAKDYKVIDGDLGVRDVAKDDLPKLPSKLVNNPATMPATTRPS